MLEAIGAGLVSLATPQAIAFMLIGVVYGLVVGILPGLGGIVAIALLLPFTYGYEIGATLALLLGFEQPEGFLPGVVEPTGRG